MDARTKQPNLFWLNIVDEVKCCFFSVLQAPVKLIISVYREWHQKVHSQIFEVAEKCSQGANALAYFDRASGDGALFIQMNVDEDNKTIKGPKGILLRH
jgi:hypothetical protein